MEAAEEHHDPPGTFQAHRLVWTTSVLLLSLYLALVYTNKTVAFFTRYYCIYLSYLVFGIIVWPLLLLKPGSPDNAWYMVLWAEYVQHPLCRLHITRMGCPYPDGPFVLVCNHQSSLDSPIMMHREAWPGSCVVIMKKSMKFSPFGVAAMLGGTLFVDRKSHNSSETMLKNAVDKILANKYRVWVFPEGTRRLMLENYPKKTLLPFKKGAFNLAVLAQVPIVPVLISPQEKFFNYRERLFKAGNITVTVLPHIPTTGLTLDDVPNLAGDVRSTMLDAYLSLEDENNGGALNS